LAHQEFRAVLPTPPVLGLLFEDEDAARKIFRGWRKKLGELDVRELLSLTLITAIDRQHPSHYRLTISTNVEKAAKDLGPHIPVFIAARIHTMTPQDDSNVRAFRERFSQVGWYLLVPAIYRGGAPRPIMELAIRKHNIRFVEAWRIDENDPDVIALQPDDDPIIPPRVMDVPVFRALEKIRRYR
ncbi:MAG: hypothetical protein ACRED0_02310, partial [Gammaproteobacteria bacterium]